MLFPTTIAGSLPKPDWLAEPNTLWAPWKLTGDALAAGKRDATLLAVKIQEDSSIDIVTDGEQARQHFVHGFLERVEGIDFAHKVEMGIRKDRYKAMVPQVVAPLRLRGRVHAEEARHARAHTRGKLKFTVPGPMTIIDTISDSYYGDRVKMAFAFAELLNEEARALQADGVDMIQFDEPAFNVYMDEVRDWGIAALERAAQGLTCTTAVHICYGYGIKANTDWKETLGGEWRQYEDVSVHRQKRDPAGRHRMPQLARAARVARTSEEQGCSGRRDRCRERRRRNRRGCRRDHCRGDEAHAKRADYRHDELRHGADAARYCRGQAESAWRRCKAGAGAAGLTVLLPAGGEKRKSLGIYLIGENDAGITSAFSIFSTTPGGFFAGQFPPAIAAARIVAR